MRLTKNINEIGLLEWDSINETYVLNYSQNEETHKFCKRKAHKSESACSST